MNSIRCLLLQQFVVRKEFAREMADSNPLLSSQFQNRIKKIMQADDDVGRVAAGATFSVGES